MKSLSYVMAVLGLAVAGGVSAQTPSHPSELEFAPLEFTMPQAQETTLDNGIRVLVFENHDLPLVTLSAHVRMGRSYLPVDQHTTMEVLSRVWDEGGAGDFSPAKLDSLVAALGMTLAAGVGSREAYVSAFFAREDLQAGAVLWRDLFLYPGFDSERIERSKSQKIKDLQGINDDPGSLASTWFWRLLAGADSPEGRVASRTEIEAVTRVGLLALHQRFVTPHATVIGMAGDITVAEARKLLEDLLHDWGEDAAADSGLEILPQIRSASPGVYVLPGDFKQCHVRMGRTVSDLTELSPDYPISKLLDFGVGFLRVFYRTRGEGLSYGTGTRLTAGPDQGTFYAQGSTRPDQVVALLQAVIEEVEAVATRPLAGFELESARTFQLGAQIRSMETARDVVRLRLEEIAQGWPDGYYRNMIASLQDATEQDVSAAGARWIGFGSQPVVLVIGNPEGGPEVLEQLGLGPVQILDSVAFGH